MPILNTGRHLDMLTQELGEGGAGRRGALVPPSPLEPPTGWMAMLSTAALGIVSLGGHAYCAAAGAIDRCGGVGRAACGSFCSWMTGHRVAGRARILRGGGRNRQLRRCLHVRVWMCGHVENNDVATQHCLHACQAGLVTCGDGARCVG
eukprot:89588-Chlamydomonas_euryale.AAC.1